MRAEGDSPDPDGWTLNPKPLAINLHTIRLGGPWQVEPLARFVPQADGTYLEITEQLPPGRRAKMPADWSAILGGEFLGRVRYSRTFHKPTGLETGHRVFLIVEAARTRAIVELNSTCLGEVRWGAGMLRVDVTELLHGDERLEMTVEHGSLEGVGGLVGEVRLEVEERD